MDSQLLKIDIGSGNEHIDGYKTVDLFVGADYRDDITKMSSFGDGTVDEVRTYHILEHLATKDVPVAMKQVFRVLKSGGKWQIEVPDLVWLCEDFYKSQDTQRWGWKLQTLFGLQNHEGEFHRTGFSRDRLAQLLHEAGFVRIEANSVMSQKYNQQVIDAVAYKP